MKSKKVYQLIFKTENDRTYDMIFSSLKKAEDALDKNYKIGMYYYGEVIINSFVTSRVLF